MFDARILAIASLQAAMLAALTGMSFASPQSERAIRMLTWASFVLPILVSLYVLPPALVSWGFAGEAYRGSPIPNDVLRKLVATSLLAIAGAAVPLAIALGVHWRKFPSRWNWLAAVVCLAVVTTDIVVQLGGIGQIMEDARRRAARDVEARLYRMETRRKEMAQAAALRTKFETDPSFACAWFGSDPMAKAEEFAACRRLLESPLAPEARWREFGNFADGSSFKRWRADQVRGDSGEVYRDSDWNFTSVIPRAEQAWFVKAYVEAWMALGDHSFTAAARGVTDALDDVSRPWWSPEARQALAAAPRGQIIARLEKLLHGESDDAKKFDLQRLIKFLLPSPASVEK